MSNLQKQNNTVTMSTNFLWHPLNHKIQKPLHSVCITKFSNSLFRFTTEIETKRYDCIDSKVSRIWRQMLATQNVKRITQWTTCNQCRTILYLLWQLCGFPVWTV